MAVKNCSQASLLRSYDRSSSPTRTELTLSVLIGTFVWGNLHREKLICVVQPRPSPPPPSASERAEAAAHGPFLSDSYLPGELLFCKFCQRSAD